MSFTVKKVYCNVYNYVSLSLLLLKMSLRGDRGIRIVGIPMESYTDLQLLCIYHHTQLMAEREGARAANDVHNIEKILNFEHHTAVEPMP